MSDLDEADMKSKIAGKLSPSRFPNVSGQMFACLGALLNQHWTTPRMASIIATADGVLLGREEGDNGFNHVIGSFEDFKRNTQD